MTPPVPPVLHPVTIAFSDGANLTTSIDPHTGVHSVMCDLCFAIVKLTRSAHRNNVDSHRGGVKCMNFRQKLISQGTIAGPVASPVTPSYAGPSSQPHSLGFPSFSSLPHSAGLPSHSHHSRQLSGTLTALSSSLSQLSTQTSASSEVPCPGIWVDWSPGSVWTTYPYQLHDKRDLRWQPIAFGKETSQICLRSETCVHPVSGSDGTTCKACMAIPSSVAFQRFIERAAEVELPPTTGWDFYTSSQYKMLIQKLSAQLAKARTMVANAKRSREHLLKKLSHHNRVMKMIASNEISGLRRMLTVALKRGTSPSSLCALLDRAIKGVYKPRGYTPRDLDISFLTKALGGPKLLYALNKSHGLASVSTVKRAFKIPHLLPSVGIPSKEEVNSNITAFLDPEIKPLPVRLREGDQIPGNVIQMDNVAIEARARYCARRDCILGLCREHASNVDTKVTSMDNIHAVRKAIFKEEDPAKKVCLAAEATVVAIAPYAQEDHYTPVPLVLSPSDKTEKKSALASWIQTVVDSYNNHEQGATLYGPIWSIASDGDSTYRAAKHQICMKKKLDPTSTLGAMLAPLIGLNYYTSKEEITTTCDPKHIFKRFATLLRHSEGIMIGDTNLKPTDIITHLSCLPGVTREIAQNLLDPVDKQNVPKAVQLIQELGNLKNLETPLNPGDAKRRDHIVFTAEFLGYFLYPFIKVEMSLSDQVRSLSTYAHLAAAMQLTHGTDCLTGALYADSQAVVKNILFTIARLKIINPDLKFYIILEGTDRLELVFSDCRIQDHARNFDIEQLSGKLSVAALVNAAFQRNPDLDRGHQRLSLKDALGIDHVNPKSWLGSVRVGDVDLELEWSAGQNAARALLKQYFDEDLDFPKIFSSPGHDLLRPAGDYVGVREDLSDLRSEILEGHGEINDPEDTTAHPSAQPNEDREIGDFDDFDLDDSQEMPIGVDPDDFLPDTLDDIEQDVEPAIVEKILVYEGKKYFKSSVVASLCSNRSKKVTMRTLRARGMTLEDFRKGQNDNQEDIPPDTDIMKEKDLAATLVRSGSKICLAVMEISGFRTGTTKEMSLTADMNDLDDLDKRITVVGQIVGLKPMTTDEDMWEWTRKYVNLDVTGKDQRLTRRKYVFGVPSVLISPLGPTPAFSRGHSTWKVKNSDLKRSLESLWEFLDPDGPDIMGNIGILPQIKNPASLPYHNAQGYLDDDTLFVSELPVQLQFKKKLEGKDKRPCHLCGEEKLISKMRDHVGKHVLQMYRIPGPPGDGNYLADIGAEPCGFCGLDGCLTQLLSKPKGGFSIESNCQYHYSSMQYKAAQRYSGASPCTNVPIHCPFCIPSLAGPKTIWKYNMMFHLLIDHSVDGKPPEIPAQLMVDMFITKKEEIDMGVQAEMTQKWREENTIPDSDGLEMIVEEMESGKRGRSDTVTSLTQASQPRDKRSRQV
ncbi:hypothetical protein FPV67DRAFT_1446920 [Lyophyllum atratum]|nr:hypothetical protein FPV67DRAFT_1446920 [Lyophyllum atratum]